ncbi:hypothetical protein [Arenimonas oryziterrae]|uniref:hypothetical protein n=1 Tax=Arenimonas oryziterrae TaxID=498055 RepID=UPI0009DBB272|nr:hypothetical protein [Arenimonas oryziterrae]
MVICPIAVAVGCRKCPVFSVCPVKNIIGDAAEAKPATAKPGPRVKAALVRTEGKRRPSKRKQTKTGGKRRH